MAAIDARAGVEDRAERWNAYVLIVTDPSQALPAAPRK